MRAEQDVGLGRVQLQHLALEVAFAVRHAGKMRAVDRPARPAPAAARPPQHRLPTRSRRSSPQAPPSLASRGSSSPCQQSVAHRRPSPGKRQPVRQRRWLSGARCRIRGDRRLWLTAGARRQIAESHSPENCVRARGLAPDRPQYGRKIAPARDGEHARDPSGTVASTTRPLTMIKKSLPYPFPSVGQADRIGLRQWTVSAAHFCRLPQRGSGGDLSRLTRSWRGRLMPGRVLVWRNNEATTDHGEHPEEDEGSDRSGAVGDPGCASCKG